MLAQSQPLSAEYQIELYRWTAAWYDELVEEGFIRPTFQPDDEIVSLLRAYFDAGLSPTEAAQAMFCDKH